MAGGSAGPIRGNPFRTGFVQREYLWAFMLVTSLFFLWGFAYGLLDVLNKHFQNVLHVTKLESTGLQVAYFGIGYFAFSPVAGECLKRRGYKQTIIMGLSLYSLGAILFWPVAKFSVGGNHKAIFGGFVICTAVIACGLATLETAANSYITVMPPHGPANFRLQVSQSMNGVASFTGPLIASKYFFSGGNKDNLTNVQWVYLAVSLMGVIVIVAFVATKLPEVSEEALESEAAALADAHGADVQALQPFRKQYRAITGFVAQFLYVGAQVTIGAFFINYAAENANFDDAQASNLLSYALILFTVGRFVGVGLLSFMSAPFLLMIYSAVATVLCVCIASIKGLPGVICLMLIMFFESIFYPIIFVVSTSGLGRHTRRGAALLVMGVSGGAVLPPIQGALADHFSTRTSYYIGVPCFLYITGWAFWVWRVDGSTWRAETGQVEHEVEVNQGTYPVGYVSQVNADGSRKEDELEYIEKV